MLRWVNISTVGKTDLLQIREDIITLIKDIKNIDFENNLKLYELLEDKSYLDTAYKQIQENASSMEQELKAKFLSYPIPAAIVEEWEKVK